MPTQSPSSSNPTGMTGNISADYQFVGGTMVPANGQWSPGGAPVGYAGLQQQQAQQQAQAEAQARYDAQRNAQINEELKPYEQKVSEAQAFAQSRQAFWAPELAQQNVPLKYRQYIYQDIQTALRNYNIAQTNLTAMQKAPQEGTLSVQIQQTPTEAVPIRNLDGQIGTPSYSEWVRYNPPPAGSVDSSAYQNWEAQMREATKIYPTPLTQDNVPVFQEFDNIMHVKANIGTSSSPYLLQFDVAPSQYGNIGVILGENYNSLVMSGQIHSRPFNFEGLNVQMTGTNKEGQPYSYQEDVGSSNLGDIGLNMATAERMPGFKATGLSASAGLSRLSLSYISGQRQTPPLSSGMTYLGGTYYPSEYYNQGGSKVITQFLTGSAEINATLMSQLQASGALAPNNQFLSGFSSPLSVPIAVPPMARQPIINTYIPPMDNVDKDIQHAQEGFDKYWTEMESNVVAAGLASPDKTTQALLTGLGRNVLPFVGDIIGGDYVGYAGGGKGVLSGRPIWGGEQLNKVFNADDYYKYTETEAQKSAEITSFTTANILMQGYSGFKGITDIKYLKNALFWSGFTTALMEGSKAVNIDIGAAIRGEKSIEGTGYSPFSDAKSVARTFTSSYVSSAGVSAVIGVGNSLVKYMPYEVRLWHFPSIQNVPFIGEFPGTFTFDRFISEIAIPTAAGAAYGGTFTSEYEQMTYGRTSAASVMSGAETGAKFGLGFAIATNIVLPWAYGYAIKTANKIGVKEGTAYEPIEMYEFKNFHGTGTNLKIIGLLDDQGNLIKYQNMVEGATIPMDARSSFLSNWKTFVNEMEGSKTTGSHMTMNKDFQVSAMSGKPWTLKGSADTANAIRTEFGFQHLYTAPEYQFTDWEIDEIVKATGLDKSLFTSPVKTSYGYYAGISSRPIEYSYSPSSILQWDRPVTEFSVTGKVTTPVSVYAMASQAQRTGMLATGLGRENILLSSIAQSRAYVPALQLSAENILPVGYGTTESQLIILNQFRHPSFNSVGTVVTTSPTPWWYYRQGESTGIFKLIQPDKYTPIQPVTVTSMSKATWELSTWDKITEPVRNVFGQKLDYQAFAGTGEREYISMSGKPSASVKLPSVDIGAEQVKPVIKTPTQPVVYPKRMYDIVDTSSGDYTFKEKISKTAAPISASSSRYLLAPSSAAVSMYGAEPITANAILNRLISSKDRPFGQSTSSYGYTPITSSAQYESISSASNQSRISSRASSSESSSRISDTSSRISDTSSRISEASQRMSDSSQRASESSRRISEQPASYEMRQLEERASRISESTSRISESSRTSSSTTSLSPPYYPLMSSSNKRKEKKRRLKLSVPLRVTSTKAYVPDIISQWISQNRYGKVTFPTQREQAKFSARNVGYVPTKEMIQRGAAKEKYPRFTGFGQQFSAAAGKFRVGASNKHIKTGSHKNPLTGLFKRK